MSGSTIVQFYKYPRTPHWRFELLELGSDRHGTWLGAHADTPGRRGSEPQVMFRDPFVMLIPPASWWTMVANADPRDPEVYVDVCTTAQWTDRALVEMVDLDLDVIRRRDGSVKLLDEDEFELHRRQLGYSESMVTSARVTAVEVMLAMEERRPPFDDTARSWLAVLERQM